MARLDYIVEFQVFQLQGVPTAELLGVDIALVAVNLTNPTVPL
jgi:hypothetical protein